MIDNFVKLVLENGGTITPLLIPSENTNGTGLCNPSIYIDNGKPIMNLRHVDYTLYHCEGEQRFQTRWGNEYRPFCYLHPEDDCVLRTINYFCELNPKTLEIQSYTKVDTSQLDIPPVWEFIGLEDARLVRWEEKLYMCGVRRDTKPNGEGRMELSEIVDGKEISRFRIEPPKDPNSYCEKNWMPIIDLPYHFVKWTNPTEVVKVFPEEGRSEQVCLVEQSNKSVRRDIRGGSQVIPFSNYRIAITHEVDLWNSQNSSKDGKYYHRFIVWDGDWNIVKVSEEFHFMSAWVEFCCGIAVYEDKVLITFAFQDNAAFILQVPFQFFKSFLGV